MDTFYQIAVIGLIISNVVLWIFFLGIYKLIVTTFEQMKDLLDKAIKEMG